MKLTVTYLNLAKRDLPYAFRGPLSGIPWRSESVILLYSMFTETAPQAAFVANWRVSEIDS